MMWQRADKNDRVEPVEYLADCDTMATWIRSLNEHMDELNEPLLWSDLLSMMNAGVKYQHPYATTAGILTGIRQKILDKRDRGLANR